jgi:hypothetical protein
MSIATDEAEKYFPTQYWPHMEPNGDYRGKECYIEGVKSSDIQEAYEQGRTAEPTEAEIEAAAKAMYDELCGNIIHGCLDENGDPQMDEDPFRTVFINAAVEALSAARKAVME